MSLIWNLKCGKCVVSRIKSINFLAGFNPLVSIAPFLYPMKTSENFKASWCFQAGEKGCTRNEWVKTRLRNSDLEVGHVDYANSQCLFSLKFKNCPF